MWISLWYERSKTPAWGLFGGEAGAKPKVEINPGTADAKEMLKVNRMPLKAGDIVLCQTGGGGGYGDPLERDPAQVRRDLAEGYITEVEAREKFGLTG